MNRLATGLIPAQADGIGDIAATAETSAAGGASRTYAGAERAQREGA